MSWFRRFIFCGVLLATLVGGATTAFGATAPGPITGTAANVSYTTASVYGEVNPNGAATTWYFEYGTSTGYGLKSATTAAGSGTANVAVSAALSGLQPGTIYHYRLVAGNESGTVPGGDATFKTPIAAPSATTTDPAAIGNTTSTLQAVVDPHGLETTVYFQYGTSTGYGINTASRSAGDGTTGIALSIGVAGLEHDTTYHVRVVASSAAGTTIGHDVSFVTHGPPRPTTTSSDGIGPNGATLNGTVYLGGHTTTWYFEWGLTTGYGHKTPTHEIAPSDLTVNVAAGISGLTPATTYDVRLVAHNADGTVYANNVAFQTLGPTISLSSAQVVYGHPVTMSGTIPTGAANVSITIFARRIADPSFVAIATVLTAVGGKWTYRAQPKVGTSYEALWDTTPTPTISVGVAPSVTLSKMSGDRFATRVGTNHSLDRRLVRLQRLSHGIWRNVASRRLNRSQSTVFHPSLPAGASKVRVVITAFQAGAGYLSGTSATRIVRIT